MSEQLTPEMKRSGTKSYRLVSPKELSIFCKQMSVLFTSQTTLMEGLAILNEQTVNKHLKTALTGMYGYMDNGDTFSEAANRYDNVFPEYLLSMIFIGETSGTLGDIFERMSGYFDKEDKIRKKLKSAITYPIILTGLMAVIVVLLIVKILPMFNDMLKSMSGEGVTGVAGVLLGIGMFLANYGWIFLVVIIAIAIAVLLYSKTNGGRVFFDGLKLKIPALKFVNSRIISARVSDGLAILLKSGTPLLTALDHVAILVGNKNWENKFKDASAKIKDGAEPVEVFGSIGLFPILFNVMFTLGQKTGNIDEMMEKCAAVFSDEADDALQKLTGLIEPILIIILSVIVGVILLSVILPMVSIMNSIG